MRWRRNSKRKRKRRCRRWRRQRQRQRQRRTTTHKQSWARNRHHVTVLWRELLSDFMLLFVQLVFAFHEVESAYQCLVVICSRPCFCFSCLLRTLKGGFRFMMPLWEQFGFSKTHQRPKRQQTHFTGVGKIADFEVRHGTVWFGLSPFFKRFIFRGGVFFHVLVVIPINSLFG